MQRIGNIGNVEDILQKYNYPILQHIIYFTKSEFTLERDSQSRISECPVS